MPPETITPEQTIESYAAPERPGSSRTNFAGGSEPGNVRIGHVVVVEVEDGVDRDQVEVRVVVGVQRPDVAPVAALAGRDPRDAVALEVPDLGAALLDHHRNDVASEVVRRRVVGGIRGDRLDQRLRVEDVVAHRCEHLVGRVGEADRVGGLLAERADRASVGGRLDHPELGSLRRAGCGWPPPSVRRPRRDAPRRSGPGSSGRCGRRRRRRCSPGPRRRSGSGSGRSRRPSPRTSAARSASVRARW